MVSMLLGSLLVDGCTWESGSATVDLLGLPDEILEQIALVLDKNQVLGCVDHIL